MTWLARKARPPQDLVSSELLARHGRAELMGWDVAGEDDTFTVFNALAPLRNAALDGALDGSPARKRAIEELRRHAAQGPWETVGAALFVRDFIPDETVVAEFGEARLRALDRMRLTNLAIHLSAADLSAYRRLFDRDPPHDGFFGPPVFDSNYGPTRSYYFDAARAASVARRPMRIAQAQVDAPDSVDELTKGLWDFGMLVLRGPLLVPRDIRDEDEVVRPAATAARGFGHLAFAEAAYHALVEQQSDRFNGWSWAGTARFVEDYLDPALYGSPAHVALIDGALESLAGFIGVWFPVETLSNLERARLAMRNP
jgi:hypothetical protein